MRLEDVLEGERLLRSLDAAADVHRGVSPTTTPYRDYKAAVDAYLNASQNLKNWLGLHAEELLRLAKERMEERT